MAKDERATPLPAVEIRAPQVGDVIRRDMRTLDDESYRVAALAVNRRATEPRSGTHDEHVAGFRDVIRDALHRERRQLPPEKLKVDPAVIPNPTVRETVEKKMAARDFSQVDLDRVNAALAELKRMPNAAEPWRSRFLDFMRPSPTERDVLGFTPGDFLRAAESVVTWVGADFS